MPDWTKYVRENLPGGGFRGELGAEIQEEIATHLEDAYAEALRRGATEDDAVARALAEVDDWERLAERIAASRRRAAEAWGTEGAEATEAALRRRGGGWGAAADMLQEFRYALRRLKKAPTFTVVVLLSLGVGIGATTAIYSVVKGVLLDPLPYPEPDRLVAVWNSAPGSGEALLPQSFGVNAVYEDDARSFESVGIWGTTTSLVNGEDGPEEVPAVAVTHGLFPALGVQPALGRGFTFEDTQVGSPRTTILDHDYWVRRYDADPGVIGTTVIIADVPREIIGVMPEGFRVMDRPASFYHPYRYTKADLTLTQFTFRSIARLRDGVTAEQALEEMARLLPMAAERYPGGVSLEMLREIEAAPVLHSLKADLVGNVGNVLWVVLGGVGIILLVACANVANLLLVQSESQERALAVQSALGSSRRRMVLRFLTESLTLGVLGGMVGIGLAVGGLRILRAVGPADLPRLGSIDLDAGVLSLALLVSVLVGVTLGVLPLVRAWRLDLSSSLKEGGRGSGAGRRRGTARNALAAAQLALAMVLMVGSGLMIRTFISLSHVAPGFSDPDRVLTFGATATATEVPDDNDVTRAHQALADRLAQLPGVESVGLSSSVPMDGRAGFDPIYIEDFPLPEGQQAPVKRFKWIGGGYHEAIGNPLVAGRAITWDDVHGLTRVVMITEGFARRVWGDPAKAVGRRISTGFSAGDWREIVGVVGDVRDDGLDQDPVDVVYWPMAMRGFWAETSGPDALFLQRGMTYVVRSSQVGTPGFMDQVREAVRASFPGRPLANPRTMASLQHDSLARTSFTLVMLGIAAAMALLLGSIGTYGVVAYAVGQRTREMGLRIAMGAEPRVVTAMVLRQGLALGVIGVAAGVLGAAGASRLMDAVLFGVSPVDPLTYGAMAGGLLAIAALATWVPARRAARVDPMVALRAE
ncbi:MAG TPA: ABC transporter permease [Longimicrobiales bacterium]|nr:ABC transporter permease [Longimicrobiales bacterium]